MNNYQRPVIHVFSVEDLATVAERDADMRPEKLIGKHVIISIDHKFIFCHFHWIDVLTYFDTLGLLDM